MSTQPDRLAKLQAYFDRRPGVSNVALVVLALPLVGLGIVILFPLITRATLKQGIVFNVAYEVIRVTASWLSDLFTNFWYVQMASIPKFEGEKQMSTAGAFVIYGTGFALVCGLVTMVINIAVAEPLLRALTPAYSDPEMLVGVALAATQVMGLFIPGRVQLSNMSGILCGQASSNHWLIWPAYGFTLGIGVISSIAMIAVFEGSGCEASLREANASAYEAADGRAIEAYHLRKSWGNQTGLAPIFDQEAWVCPDAERALVAGSWIEAVAQWAGSLSSTAAAKKPLPDGLHHLLHQRLHPAGSLLMLGVVVSVSRRRGYFTEHGCHVKAYATSAADQASAVKLCSVSLLSVNVRSILNNTRELITTIVATRIGVADAAVVNFFEAIGQLTYAVPNICSFGMMAIGARLLGAGRLREFRRHVYGHVFFAFFCAVVFTALSVLSSEIELEDEFTNMVDREDFEPLAKELWPIAILLQPFRAIVAVYGPILMACQGYVEWGVTVTALFLLLYLPLTVAGAVQNDVRLLMWANVAYYMVHSVLLIGLVHCRMLPRLLRPKPSSTQPEDAVSSTPAAAANQGSLAPTEA